MLVAMAAREKLVRTDIRLATPIITRAWNRPARPTTYPSLRKRMMPMMVRILGVKTPAKVPSPFGADVSFGCKGDLLLKKQIWVEDDLLYLY